MSILVESNFREWMKLQQGMTELAETGAENTNLIRTESQPFQKENKQEPTPYPTTHR